MDRWHRSLKTGLLLPSVLAMFVYYSASIAFGAAYNQLHLIYIALFSSSLFGFILAMTKLDYDRIQQAVKLGSHTGYYIFLTLTGAALFGAWLPDIIGSLLTGRPLSLIEVYTTEITYVLDMGIISPLAFVAIYLLKKRRGIGYVLMAILLTVCSIMGVILATQSVFQVSAGIDIPVPALITKAGTFIVLAVFALYFNIKLMRAVQE